MEGTVPGKSWVRGGKLVPELSFEEAGVRKTTSKLDKGVFLKDLFLAVK